jgi:signal recognition particle subunit SRP54
LGDWTGFIDKIADVIPADQQPELLDKLAQGQFTMRILYEQFANIQKMGPMSAVMSMIPGFGNDVMPKGQEKQSQAKIKRMMCMMDSMTDEELDTTSLKLLQDPKRMERIGRGAGRSPMDVVELIEEYKRLAKMMGKMKGLKAPKKGGYGQSQALNQVRGVRSRLFCFSPASSPSVSTLDRVGPFQLTDELLNFHQNLAQMAQAIPPGMLKQMGGMGALQGMMKQLEGKDMGEMEKMMGKMMGGGGRR